jgi:hypothetical protein
VASINEGGDTIMTSSFRPCPESVPGMHLASKDFQHTARIASLKGRTYQLDGPRDMRRITKSLKQDGVNDLWIVDFGVGDEAEVEVFAYESKVIVDSR